MSIPRALLLALALLQALGITDVVRRDLCEVECQGDGCDDKGPCDSPACAYHCPSAPTLTPPLGDAVAVAVPVESRVTVVFQLDTLRASPDPREILHVPRRQPV